jgi:cellulose synthase/poly-beta-1,6-N-acetylglucosamine synthase-like glycosyltransferase
MCQGFNRLTYFLPGFRWWMPSLAAGAALVGLFAYCVSSPAAVDTLDELSHSRRLITTVLHLPFFMILLFLAAGFVERLGFYWRGREPDLAGQLPAIYPTVCVQLPMFNEHAVAQRVIEAACAMNWPIDRLTVQVLDDSTDEDTQALVDDVCARVRAATGVNCYVRRRVDRQGYKAGALDAGRRETDAEFLAIFDSDFLPPRDYLLRTVPHFYQANGEPEPELALVQAQWGHLNHDESFLTLAQSLWVDDHHTLQMSWRSAVWRFVNFTGTAGIWRASAIESVGGWSSASLVEDCELSFRHLFASYRTKFVKEIVAPAELPATYTAYKAQQKRWTQGWVQLQKLHLATLLFRFRCSWPRRIHLVYHMCNSWQWPLWTIWIMTLPVLIYTGHWFGSVHGVVGPLLYLLPPSLWAVLAATVASLETKHSYASGMTPAVVLRRIGRIVPYLVINTGMLPHQFSSFAEGLFGPLHSEFERTPKAASVTTSSHRKPPGEQAGAAVGLAQADTSNGPSPTARKPYSVKIRWPYVLAEAFLVAYQLAWMVLFASSGLVLCAIGAGYIAACVAYLGFFYGDHEGKVCFIIDGSRMKLRRQRMLSELPAASRSVS